jgi:hypothetical protein
MEAYNERFFRGRADIPEVEIVGGVGTVTFMFKGGLQSTFGSVCDFDTAKGESVDALLTHMTVTYLDNLYKDDPSPKVNFVDLFEAQRQRFQHIFVNLSNPHVRGGMVTIMETCSGRLSLRSFTSNYAVINEEVRRLKEHLFHIGITPSSVGVYPAYSQNTRRLSSINDAFKFDLVEAVEAVTESRHQLLLGKPIYAKSLSNF